MGCSKIVYTPTPFPYVHMMMIIGQLFINTLPMVPNLKPKPDPKTKPVPKSEPKFKLQPTPEPKPTSEPKV